MDIERILKSGQHILLNDSKMQDLSDKTKTNVAMLKIRKSLYLRHIKSIVDMFNKNRIPFVLLKSAKDVYVDGYEFFQGGDIDLFVRKRDFKKTDMMFKKAGYTTKEYVFPESYLERFSFHFRYSRNDYNNPVEVHWGLIDKVYPVRFDNELVWKQRVIHVKGSLYKLEPEFEALYLILSTFRDFGGGYIKNRFRIKRLMEKDFNLRKFRYYQRYHNLKGLVDCFFGEGHGLRCRLFWNKVDGRIKENLFYHYLFLLMLFPGLRYWWYYIKKEVWFNLYWWKPRLKF